MIRIKTLQTLAGLVAAVALAPSPAFAQTTPGFRADLVHSQAQFAIKHFVISTVRGSVKFTALDVVPSADSPIPKSIDATLDAASEDSGDASRDRDVHSDSFFDVAKYPTMTFKSTKITASDAKNFTILGDLTLHGVTKPVTFSAQYVGDTGDARGNQRSIYTATTKIDRRDFGINWAQQTPGGALIVGNDVELTINVELVKT